VGQSSGLSGGRNFATPEDFGARGGARQTESGWVGADDTGAINRAIRSLAASGGGDLLLSGLYFLDSQLAQTRSFSPDSSDPSTNYAVWYLIDLPWTVRLVFTQNAGLVSNPLTSRDDFMPTVGILIDSPHGVIRNLSISGGRIEGFTFGIASFRNVCVSFRLDGIRFARCAVGFYGLILEQTSLTNITGLDTGSIVVVGGAWANNKDEYNGLGGYSDKSNFTNLRLESGWSADRAALVDKWFEQNIFRSDRNRTLVRTSQQSPATNYPYSGICGYSIRVMARYSRPSDSNVIISLSHQNAMRAAIRIDNGKTNTAIGVYCENVGYARPVTRDGGFGGTETDPYLGRGRRLPNLVSGIGNLLGLNLQYCFSANASDSPRLMDGAYAMSDIAKP
jgi:hypothetical protein